MLFFSALGLFWLLLHIANASLNSSYYQNSSLLNANGNSSSLANGTTLTSHAAERTLYDIWTVTSTNVNGNTDTFNKLLALGLSESEIYIVGAAPGLADVNLFQVKLTEDMHSNFVPGENVHLVVPACVADCQSVTSESETRTTIRKRFLKTWEDAEPDLSYISQPKMQEDGVGANFAELNDEYVYDSSSGKGATVYMLDTGAYPEHEEFVDIAKSWKWAGPSYARTVDGEYPAPEEGDYDHPNDHGTTTLSKIAGKTLGVVKNPLVVVVRAPRLREDWGIVEWLQQINWIIENWGNVREDGRLPVGIVCMAGSFVGEGELETEEDEKALSDFADRLSKASSEGLVLISASGNDGGPVDAWPQLYRSTVNWNWGAEPFVTAPVPQLVVVGATDITGSILPLSKTADFVDLTAPGDDIKVAYSGGPRAFAWGDGTSQACAQVVGLAAYIAGLESTNRYWTNPPLYADHAAEVRTKLLDLAYPRQLGDLAQYPKGLWNGVTDVACVHGYGSAMYQNRKRDSTYDACGYGASSSSIASIVASSATSFRVPGPSPTNPSSTVSSIRQSSTASSLPTGQEVYTNATFSQESVILGMTQTDMMSSLGQLLNSLCPPYSQRNECSNQTDSINNVYSHLVDTVYHGELNVWVEDSAYTSEARRQSLLIMAATTMAQSASNCANITYKEGNCPGKRSYLAEREVGGSGACVTEAPIWMCAYASNVLVMAFDETTTSFDYINLNIQFKENKNGQSICADLAEALQLDEAMMVLFPEFDILWAEIRVELGEATAICEDIDRAIEYIDDS